MIKTAIDLYEKAEASIRHAQIMIESEVSEDMLDEELLSPLLDSPDSDIDIDPDAITLGLDFLDNDVESQIEMLMDMDYDKEDIDVDDLLEIQSTIE